MAALFFALSAPAQTLAHPNWVGNGMSTDPWWQHAVIYRISSTPGSSPAIDFNYLSTRINSMRSVGVDAILLPAPPIPGQGSAAPPSGQPTEVDQLDDLIRLASGRGIRILLALTPASSAADLSGVARFWLSRGVAGFYIVSSSSENPADTLATVQSLRRLTASSVGQRIVISDSDPAAPDSSVATQTAAPVVRRAASSRIPRTPDLAPLLELRILESRIDPAHLNAATLRPALSQAAFQPNLLLDLSKDAAGPDPSSASRVLAALSLLTHPAAMLDSNSKLVFDPTPVHPDADDDPRPKPTPAPAPGVFLPYKPYVAPVKTHNEPPPKDPLTLWYKQLAALHHGSAAIRAGNPVFLDFDAQNALVWVARSGTASSAAPPVVVACNLSGSPLTLSLRSPLEALGLRGNYLRTELRSDRLLGPQDITTVTLPPYGVYIGEIRR